nr:hypothetical protein [Tanacetum cinerariifolium]
MATTIEQQTALDESLVPSSQRKSVLDLEAFREMLHISPRIPNQPFADLPTEDEVLDFLRFLGHSHDIRYLTDVNVNKLYQPWRSFASVINKCLTCKSSGVDSFRFVGNKMHKAFPLLGESSHWQYKFPLPVEGVPTARRMEILLPEVCTAIMKKLPVKENWQLN